VAAVNGIATFANLTLDKMGEYTLVASTTGGLPSVTTNTFDVTPAAAAKLAFIVEPTNTEALFPIIPAPQVRLRDAFDNPVAENGVVVTMQIGANPGGGTLGGDNDDGTNDNGVAVFSGLFITQEGVDYTLIATSPGLTQAESRKFRIR
jgi:hypothetical protein